jgi:hypothetical protein
VVAFGFEQMSTPFKNRRYLPQLEHGIAVAPAFAKLNPQQHSFAVDIGDLQCSTSATRSQAP